VCYINKTFWLAATGALLLSSVLFLTLVPALAGQQDIALTTSLFSKLRITVPNKPTIMDDIVLPDLSGHIEAVRKQPGSIIFVNFWASWCPDCRHEMPAMERLYNRFKDKGLAMVAVNLMEPPDIVRSFRDEYGLTFPQLLDQTGEMARRFSLRSIPTTYLLDDKGLILGRAAGSRNWDSDDAIRLFNLLLHERPQASSSKSEP